MLANRPRAAGAVRGARRRGSDTIDQVSAAVLVDPWQMRMDRMRRLLPVPLLAVSTAGALVSPSAGGGWTARDTALVAAAAVWSAVVTARLRPDASPRWRLVAFAVHTALAALLVGIDTWFGVFAYSGFLFAHGLGRALADPGVRGHGADGVRVRWSAATRPGSATTC